MKKRRDKWTRNAIQYGWLIQRRMCFLGCFPIKMEDDDLFAFE